MLFRLLGPLALGLMPGFAPGVALTAQSPQGIALPRPAPDVFVIDDAGLIDADDRGRVEALAAQLRAELGEPLFVVTIERMADHWSGGDIRIETFAHLLFDQWGIGTPDPTKNKGILLLVSKGDRKARIQLGAGWGRANDAASRRIMNGAIVPRFKSGRFSQGILAGVVELDRMARGATASAVDRATTPPSRGRSAMPPVEIPPVDVTERVQRGLPCGVTGVGMLFVVFLVGTVLFGVIRNRRRGGGDDDHRGGGSGGSNGFWSWLMYSSLFNSGSRSSSSSSSTSSGRSGVTGSSSGFGSTHSFGGFGGGGSFGGGFSGGGGASGSW